MKQIFKPLEQYKAKLEALTKVLSIDVDQGKWANKL